MLSESCNSHEDSAAPQKDSDQTQAQPSKFVVVKVYEPKGELTLHRLSSSTPYMRSLQQEESKAVTLSCTVPPLKREQAVEEDLNSRQNWAVFNIKPELIMECCEALSVQDKHFFNKGMMLINDHDRYKLSKPMCKSYAVFSTRQFGVVEHGSAANQRFEGSPL
jgi:hypothetical protein